MGLSKQQGLRRVQYFHGGESNPNYRMAEPYMLLSHKSLLGSILQW